MVHQRSYLWIVYLVMDAYSKWMYGIVPFFLGCDESRTRVRGGKSRVTLFFQFIGAGIF